MQTFQITITGQVQGVGFRPFLFNLAKRHGLSGEVYNNEKGVIVTVNGKKKEIVTFVQDIVGEAPSAAIIQSHGVRSVAFKGFEDFTIVPSKKEAKIALPLTADFAICSSCVKEIKDPKNRRYYYAFTTCTQCGPRYAITRRFPFERNNTAMSDFKMCSDCKTEYQTPSDVRFHSQTNSCRHCGIQMQLLDAAGKWIERNQDKIIKRTAALLSEGAIVAVKNTNGYLLCADASNAATITRLRDKKQRPTKPFALLYPCLESVQHEFEVSEAEASALTSAIAPIVILSPLMDNKGSVSTNVAPGMGNFGIMLPSTGMLTLLMEELQGPLVATSGNIHGSPILSENEDVLEKLNGLADYYVQHNLDISFPQDDSVMKFTKEERIILRRSRGMAPNFLTYSSKSEQPILAMGGHLKSTVAFTPNAHTYVSPYFGNLDNYDVLRRVSDTIDKYTQLFETIPSVVLVDKHPNYQSTQLGLELAGQWEADTYQIQHHKAHFASVLAEHDLFDTKEKILGVIWDGTGFGDDGMIWGGELFTYNAGEITRTTHFEYFDWLAADKMAKEPRLSLFSLLSTEHHEEVRPKFSTLEWNLYQKIKARNSLKTSSVGRLFDAVACLLGIQDISTFEGEAAMRLENCAVQNVEAPLIDLLEGEELTTIPSYRIVQKLISLKQAGASTNYLAASFIHTLACVIVEMAGKFKSEMVACSGGVFQNAFLGKRLMALSAKHGIAIKLNKELSPNDENIALGQLAYFENIK